jgi:hypothetical protein
MQRSSLVGRAVRLSGGGRWPQVEQLQTDYKTLQTDKEAALAVGGQAIKRCYSSRRAH